MAKKEIVTCDICQKEIHTSETSNRAEQWIDAGVYGVETHVKCLEELSVVDALHKLRLDDIQLVKPNGDRVKYIYERGSAAMDRWSDGKG